MRPKAGIASDDGNDLCEHAGLLSIVVPMFIYYNFLRMSRVFSRPRDRIPLGLGRVSRGMFRC
jgi:hypothetical protein